MKAEAAAEAHMIESKQNSKHKKKKGFYVKQRCKKIGGMLKEERKEKKKVVKTKQLLIEHLGSKDAVTATSYKGKRSFVYKCPECNAFISEKLARHLEKSHKKHWKEARLTQSKMRVLYLWCIADKHSTHLPLPCEPCGEWHLRLDKHLKTHKVFFSKLLYIEIYISIMYIFLV